MDFVLDHQHEHAPARERGAGRIDHLHATREPRRRGLAQKGAEALRRPLEPRQPRPLVPRVGPGLSPNPALAAIRAREVQARGANVLDHQVLENCSRQARSLKTKGERVCGPGYFGRLR
jgi:hypothetical protein